MIPWHVVSGMNGAIMVLPRSGLKDGAGNPLRYDRVYYIGEQDFYAPRDHKGRYKTHNSLGRLLHRHDGGDAHAQSNPRRVQRQGRRAYRQECDDQPKSARPC